MSAEHITLEAGHDPASDSQQISRSSTVGVGSLAERGPGRRSASPISRKPPASDPAEGPGPRPGSDRPDRDLPGTAEGRAAAELHVVLDNDPTLIPALIAWLRATAVQLRLFDAGTADRVDVALNEALINAIHHGNLELDSRFREGDADPCRRVEARRRRLPYRERRVSVHARLSRAEAVYVIRDEGPGFDPATVPDPTDPANLEKASGRGLLLIRAYMDEVIHNRTGNQVTLIKRREASAS